MFGGDHPLFVQSWEARELLSGTVNADGWGISWWRDGEVARLARAEPSGEQHEEQHLVTVPLDRLSESVSLLMGERLHLTDPAPR